MAVEKGINDNEYLLRGVFDIMLDLYLIGFNYIFVEYWSKVHVVRKCKSPFDLLNLECSGN